MITMNQYSEVGLTAEKMADITCELIEILMRQLDIPACLREIKDRHPEFTKEQLEALELDREFTSEDVEKFYTETFGGKDGLRQQMLIVYGEPEPEKLEEPETETESVD